MCARPLRRPFLVAFAGLVLAAGGASAGYVGLGWSRVSQAAVGAEIAVLLAEEAGGEGRPGVREVYRALDGRPLWFEASARGAALDVIGRADRDGLPLDQTLAALGATADTASTARSWAALDLAVTDALLRFGDALGRPRVDAADLYGDDWTPSPPEPRDAAARLARALAVPGRPAADALAEWADALRPQHPGYRRLRAALAQEMDLAAVPALDRDLAPGDTGAAVRVLRRRLAAEGLAVGPGATFDAETGRALRDAQRRRQLAATGRLDGPTRRALNRRRPELVPLMQVNLEKWRWLPRHLGDLHVWVNVPRYELALREWAGDDWAGDDWADAIRFVAVVGASDWQTPSFSDTLETVVFNPTWSVPASIQRESYGRYRGAVVRPPGPGNAMGRVKFLFPNRHSVYVHDTPSKWAFSLDDRARSHGCVRAGDPEGLARELLTRTNGWDAERVGAIFRGPWRGPQPHAVEATVPVHLVYFTAEVDADGRLRVWDDVYGRDAALAEALGVDLPALTSDAVATLIADDVGDERRVLESGAQDAASEEPGAPAPTAPTRLLTPTAPAPEPTAPVAPTARPTLPPAAPEADSGGVLTPPGPAGQG